MSLDKDLATARLNFDEWAIELVQGTLFSMTSRIIKESPVDTGRFRNNWFASIGRPIAGTTQKTERSGSAAINRAGKIIEALDKGETFYLANNLPYAQRLEYGSSDQAPQGMLRINVERVRAAMPKT